jgi:hypothetical protein
MKTYIDGDSAQLRARINEYIDNINIIVITAQGRSGSTLLQTLLDGHVEVFSLPGFHYKYDYLVGRQDPVNAADDFVKNNPGFFNTEQSYFGRVGIANASLLGECGDKHAEISTELFLEKFTLIASHLNSPINRKSFFCIIHIAAAMALGNDPFVQKYILFHLHDNRYDVFREIMDDFPNCRLIATTRDPRESIASWKEVVRRRRNWSNNFSTIVQSAINILDAFEMLERFLMLLRPNQWMLVDLARIHTVQDLGMRNLAAWLGISYDDGLCTTTVLGLVWWGNDHRLRPISGFDKDKSRKNFANILQPFEILLLEHIFVGILNSLEYERQMPPQDEGLVFFKAATAIEFILGDSLFHLSRAPGEIAAAMAHVRGKANFAHPALARLPLPLAKAGVFMVMVLASAKNIIGETLREIYLYPHRLRMLRQSLAKASTVVIRRSPGDWL